MWAEESVTTLNSFLDRKALYTFTVKCFFFGLDFQVYVEFLPFERSFSHILSLGTNWHNSPVNGAMLVYVQSIHCSTYLFVLIWVFQQCRVREGLLSLTFQILFSDSVLTVCNPHLSSGCPITAACCAAISPKTIWTPHSVACGLLPLGLDMTWSCLRSPECKVFDLHPTCLAT